MVLMTLTWLPQLMLVLVSQVLKASRLQEVLTSLSASSDSSNLFFSCMAEKLTEEMLIWYATTSIRMLFLCFLSIGSVSTQRFQAKLCMKHSFISCTISCSLQYLLYGSPFLIINMIRKLLSRTLNSMKSGWKTCVLEQKFSGNGLSMVLSQLF